VRSHQLETALTTFAADAGRHLQGLLDAGSEIPFELERGGFSRARTPLYCYRPLTSEFISARWPELSALSTHARAAAELERFEGLDRYLSSSGADAPAPRGRAPLGLRVMLHEVFAEQSDFELHQERLQGALERLARASLAGAGETTCVATLCGMTLASEELALADGLRIAHAGALPALPEEVRPVGPTDEIEQLLAVLTLEQDDSERARVEARARLRDLLGALRLFGDARVALGGLAWVRLDGGRWRPLALALGGRPHGMLIVTQAQEEQLRAFYSLLSRRRPQEGELAWALGRFQLGCEREREHEALSDYLLALRVLLEPDGAPPGALSRRLAALCALPEQRAELTALVLRALELERAVIRGRPVENAASEQLVRTIADHLRAILRDVICGHLDGDLVSLADGMLATPARSQDLPADELDEQRLRLVAMPG
jgi:hypothetical protein